MMPLRSLGWLFSGIKDAYNEINPATLTGANDIIVVEDNNGNFRCGPFHVRFGKMGAINPADKIVEIYVNDSQVENLHMRLASAGSAYFVDDVESLFFDSDSDTLSIDESFGADGPIIRVRSADDVNGKIANQHWYRRRIKKSRMDLSVSDSQSNAIKDTPSVPPVYMSDGEIEKCCRAIALDCGDMGSGVGTLNPGGPIVEKAGLAISQLPQTSDQLGVYLEDLVAPSVDENVKQAYLYVKRSNENATDAGYKSDPENNYCFKSDSPKNCELKFSLCGGLSADSQIEHERFCASLVTYEEFSKDPASIIADPNLVLRLNNKFYNWNTAAPMILSRVCFGTELPYTSVLQLEESFMPKKQPRRRAWFAWGASDPDPQPTVIPDVSKSSADASQELQNNNPQACSKFLSDGGQRPQRRISLTSKEVEYLGLRPGTNNIEFRIVTKYQGTASCVAKIYLWRADDKVIVSDVDGTITRSDILGHFLPILGRDWTHEGIAKLYSKIADNGYKFVYLSARAIGQASLTRSYIDQVCQCDKYRLPCGPILLSPTSLLDAFHREVIARTPEVFKIECLSKVKELFGSGFTPLYAAFGNRINDVKAYVESGIEPGRIFTVYPKGELRNERLPFVSYSFENIIDLVDLIFPCICSKLIDSDLIESDEENSNIVASDVDMSIFSSFAFWREPILSETPASS